MDDPEHFRARAVRLYAVAIQTRDTNPEYADRLIAEAIELQDRAEQAPSPVPRTEQPENEDPE